MRQTNFYWHPASGMPVLDRRLTRATVAAVLLDWRKSARVGVARLRRVVLTGARAYLVERRGALAGLYVQPAPLVANKPTQALAGDKLDELLTAYAGTYGESRATLGDEYWCYVVFSAHFHSAKRFYDFQPRSAT